MENSRSAAGISQPDVVNRQIVAWEVRTCKKVSSLAKVIFEDTY